MSTLLIILSILLLLLLASGYYFSTMIIKPKTLTYDELINIEFSEDRGDIEKLNKLHKEVVSIISDYEYKLKGWYFPTPGADKTVIIVHGITYNLYGSVKYMDLFIKRGFNVLIYDHRNHGKSGGNNTTFGYYEKYDLKKWTDWIIDKHGKNHVIGIMGESMGAATVLQSAAIEDRVTFYIADCPYSDMKEELSHRLRRDYKLPNFPLLPIANLFVKLRTGIWFKDVSPIKDLDKISTPILFVHGDKDDYVPTQMSIDMYNIKSPGYRKLYLAKGAKHAVSYWENKEKYDKVVGAFLEEINIK